MTWFSAAYIWDSMNGLFPEISLSSVYRTLVRFGINTKPPEEKAKKFKAYEPGYLHIDVTYLPKIQGIKHYLYVAIDRATRLMIYKIYDAKTSENTDDFANLCKEFFPFKITHILTEHYPDKTAMENSLKKFLLFYIIYRRHGGLYKELKVRTPMESVEKWYKIKPKIFTKKPKELLTYLKRLLI